MKYNMIIFVLIFFFKVANIESAEPVTNCRDRSEHLRQDGGLCREIAPWQHRPVKLDEHLINLKNNFGNITANRRFIKGPPTTNSVNREVSRYMDLVLAPFLDTYHRKLQNAYQQLTAKILKRIKEEINAAVQKKQNIYKELNNLAEKLKVPENCDEERRMSRTLSSKHLAKLYSCTEEARSSIAKMGKYAEEMIGITKNHMQYSLNDAVKVLETTTGGSQTNDVKTCLEALSRSAVTLGYELDLSLTNARRHNEQSCEKLTSCSVKARKLTDEAVAELRENLYQCVYA